MFSSFSGCLRTIILAFINFMTLMPVYDFVYWHVCESQVLRFLSRKKAKNLHIFDVYHWWSNSFYHKFLSIWNCWLLSLTEFASFFSIRLGIFYISYLFTWEILLQLLIHRTEVLDLNCGCCSYTFFAILSVPPSAETFNFEPIKLLNGLANYANVRWYMFTCLCHSVFRLLYVLLESITRDRVRTSSASDTLENKIFSFSSGEACFVQHMGEVANSKTIWSWKCK